MASNASEAGAGPAKESTSYLSPLYISVPESSWPIVYHPSYNISFAGLEKLHPFDSGKWGKIVGFLIEAGLLQQHQLVQPLEAQEADLLKVHTADYLNSLKWSANVARVTEVGLVAMLPNFIVQRKVLKPFRFHVGGTVLAAKLALDRGWAINIGGGFHHCCGYRGGGFCAYADITMAVKFLQRGYAGPQSQIQRAMIVDLDAHQGNGHERDFLGDKTVFILDAYNVQIYPGDNAAKPAISCSVDLTAGVGDNAYLDEVSKALEESLNGSFQPQLVLYNAGTDIMDGDPLGLMRITPNGIIKRDELVFRACRTRSIPVVMVTSGGYQRSNARVIADSILNLRDKGLIEGPTAG
ncbi:hypothetical protein BOX15_Mlig012185g2 [Macrostomum lignano]|uniref:Histone deacetylase 11 n=1 Tax=Macrostomum lignano TaxID=282301 RepID=A0A267ERZ3_9PLAT|nr:hypothetical protein BOX15_Mlig012185g2 [Macrostomum lignano]